MDMQRVYMRQQRVHTVPEFQFEFSSVRSTIESLPGRVFEKAILCFCARAYPFYILEGNYCASGEELVEAWRKVHGKATFVDDDMWSLDDLLDCDLRTKVPYFRYLTERANALRGAEIGDDIHRTYSAPALLIEPAGTYVVSEYSITTNPVLEALGMRRWIDPFTCYQEIAMYLGNQLAQPDIAPQSVGSDKDLAKAKGFDEQSFRTAAPGQKKLNRKANKERKRRRD